MEIIRTEYVAYMYIVFKSVESGYVAVRSGNIAYYVILTLYPCHLGNIDTCILRYPFVTPLPLRHNCYRYVYLS